VSAQDKSTGKEQQITIQSSGGLSKSDIEKMVRDAESHAEADKRRKKMSEAKNNADTSLYQVQKTLDEHRDKLPSETVAAVETALKALKDVVETEKDPDQLNKHVDNLNKAAMKIGDAIYKQRGSGGGGGSSGSSETGGTETGPTGTGSGKEGETTVDAEYEETPKKK